MRYQLLLTLLVIAAPALRADERPNILFFLSDDHRWDQLSCAGNPILKTPNLDALAAKGTRFSNAFVTTSICAASRATIFTGLYERTNGHTFRVKPIAQQHCDSSYPQLLKQAGYRTGFVGKFGVGVQQGTTGKWFDMFKPLNRNPYHKKQPDGSTRHVTEIAGDKAIEFLEGHQKDKPFSLSVSFNAAHAEDSDKKDHFPWPVAMNGMYDDITMPEPLLNDAKIYDGHPEFLKKSLNRQRFFWRWDKPEKYQRNMKAYYRMLSGLDHVIGRVMQKVEDLGMTDNTIVIFCGDNGYYMGQRGFAGKWSHYEESLRVPMIIVDPRVQKQWHGQVNDSVVLNVDLPATMLAYAGVDVPNKYQGNSLAGLVRGANGRGWRQDFFCEHLMHMPPKPNSDDGGIPKWEGVRGRRFTYARYFEQEPVYEFLHDLENDPNQLVNLATDPTHAGKLAELRKRTDELRDSYGGKYSLEKYPLAKPRQRRQPQKKK
jgi:arylsulfatase A-like enzyme